MYMGYSRYIRNFAISMARSKNTRKGKAPSSSMERAVKKGKANTS